MEVIWFDYLQGSLTSRMSMDFKEDTPLNPSQNQLIHEHSLNRIFSESILSL